MKLFEPIVVDLYKPFPLKKVDMQQNNIGRGVIVTLTAGSAIVDPSDEDVKLWAERPDGKISYLSCTVQADGTIRAPFSSQMLSVPGEVIVSLEMISGEDNITTPVFKVGVGRNIADHAAAESQNEFSALQKSISELNAALAEVEELKEKGLSKVTFFAYSEFPEEGNAEMLYVDTTVTDKLMVYRWNGTGYIPAGENIVYSTYSEFPEEGNAGQLYVDTSDTEKLMMYRWDGTEYVPAGVDVVDPALATVLGFAADAKLTGDALSELNKNLNNIKESLITGIVKIENKSNANENLLLQYDRISTYENDGTITRIKLTDGKCYLQYYSNNNTYVGQVLLGEVQH